MVRLLLSAGCLLMMTALASDAAPAPEKGDRPALAVSIAVPDHHGKRNIYLGKEIRDTTFHVVVANNSGKPINLWREWCSWGYPNLSFEVDLGDGKIVMLKKKAGEWTKNYPDFQTLKPGDLYVIPVKFDGTLWELPIGKGEASKARDLKMRAVYHIETDEDSRKSEVWTGRIESRWETYSFWGNP
jgi:hypothetical protein